MYHDVENIKIFQASSVPDAWAKCVVNTSGWSKEHRLNLFLGTAPAEEESGRTIWYGQKTQTIGEEGLWDLTEFGEWDCTILLTTRATDRFHDCPAYVAWVLAHEVGHALLMLCNPVLESVFLFVQSRIVSASAGAIIEYDDLPHEQVCDRFGRWVAEQVVGKAAFEEQMLAMSHRSDSPMGATRIRRVLDSEPLHSLPDMMEPLRTFCAPYAARLREMWLEDQQRGEASYVFGIPPDVLFGGIP